MSIIVQSLSATPTFTPTLGANSVGRRRKCRTPVQSSWPDVARIFDLPPMVAAPRAVGLVEALRPDAAYPERAGMPEHALTVRRVHVLGKDQHRPCPPDKLFQHRA